MLADEAPSDMHVELPMLEMQSSSTGSLVFNGSISSSVMLLVVLKINVLYSKFRYQPTALPLPLYLVHQF